MGAPIPCLFARTPDKKRKSNGVCCVHSPFFGTPFSSVSYTHLDVYKRQQSGRLPCLSKTQLAEDICAPIRSLNRLIAENTALVRYENRAFSVVDRERLASLCAEIQAVLWQQAD